MRARDIIKAMEYPFLALLVKIKRILFLHFCFIYKCKNRLILLYLFTI